MNDQPPTAPARRGVPPARAHGGDGGGAALPELLAATDLAGWWSQIATPRDRFTSLLSALGSRATFSALEQLDTVVEAFTSVQDL